MSLSSNLFKNAGAGTLNKVSSIIFRIVQVPIFIKFLGVEDFGRWLVIYSIPSWLILANLGFGSVAANEISILISRGKPDRAKIIFSTTLALVFSIGIIAATLISITLPRIPIENFLDAGHTRHFELTRSIEFLSISVFISFLSEVFVARFRAAQKAYLGTLISSLLPWLEFAAIFLVLSFSSRFDHLALALVCANGIYLLIVRFVSSKIMRELKFSISDVSFSEFRPLLNKSFAFLSFPLGNALLFQGNLMIVQYLLGAQAVVIFGTVRAMIRAINQLMELINSAIWPELSHLFGKNDLVKAARLHRFAVSISLLVAITGCIFLSFFGNELYSLWVGEAIGVSSKLIILFLLPVIANSLWSTSSIVHIASNNHEQLAIRFVIASAFSTVSCFMFSSIYGIYGAALATLTADLILIPFVFKKSLQLTNDNLSLFFRGIFSDFKELPKHLRRTF